MTLSRRLRCAVAIVIFMAGAASAALAGASASAAPGFKVSSTLAGKSVLPHRVHWVARTSLGRGRVGEVAFLIDGKVRWVERDAPYTYSEDGGYLVTSWLRPGRHRFTVRVTSTDGRSGTHTVVARVMPAREPPAELAGSWQRDVPGTQASLGGPPGVYTLVVERRWIQDRAPGTWDPSGDAGFGGIVDNDWIPGASTFEIAGSVTFRVLQDDDAEGGWWCEPWGPKATYSWSVSGGNLTLAPVSGSDPCAERGAVYSGIWTRVS